MRSFLATAIACGLLLSPAFAQISKTRSDVDVDERYLTDKPPKARVDDGLVKPKDFKRYIASGTSTMLGFYTALNPDCTVWARADPSKNYMPVFLIAIVPIPIFWLIGWIVFRVSRWVRRGFQTAQPGDKTWPQTFDVGKSLSQLSLSFCF